MIPPRATLYPECGYAVLHPLQKLLPSTGLNYQSVGRLANNLAQQFFWVGESETGVILARAFS